MTNSTFTTGDIFSLPEGRGALIREDRDFKLVTLLFADNTERTYPRETLTEKPIRPSAEWFLCNAPLASSRMVAINAILFRKVVPLILYEDWVPSDRYRKGGPFFLNPRLQFKPGDILTLIFENGKRSKFVLPNTLKKISDIKSQNPNEPEDLSFVGYR